MRAVATAVTTATPEFAEVTDPKLERDVQHATRVALGRFLDLVGTAEPALPSHVREAFVALGAAEAREGRGPEALLAAFRIASRMVLRAATQALARTRQVAVEEVIDLADAVTAFVDELVAASTDGFALQLREMAGEGDRRRRRLAELLLRGNAVEAVARSAAAGIGWQTLGVVVPVLLPADQARDIRFRYGGDGVVLDRERDAVLLLRDGPRATRTQLVEALRGRGAVVGPATAWSAVPEGVRLAELTAELLRSAARMAGPSHPSPRAAGLTGRSSRAAGLPGPVFVEDHLVALVLAGEPGALTVLAARRLAPLSGLSEIQRERLLETLHSWLVHWGSRSEVSAELFVHPQTVSYRLRRLRELFGTILDDATARFELLLVLASRVPATDLVRGDATTVHRDR